MWENDKKFIRAVRECYANMQVSIDAGEEVDYSSHCIKETDALIKYTIKQMNKYRASHPQEVAEKKARNYNPKMPYFQNL
ncbi:UNKNOWN [Stylonychia lemnae]|uniref:Uncharacterized protein n=1 Tax=Stylonychia lemnae TaxID=5949 RepID=A0A078ADU3_STYLE|nr:UNKNOWN [Stylonychia lemnae]|eukprot:CDW79078.1 UNKNOWN [Stylonychia lemnae]